MPAEIVLLIPNFPDATFSDLSMSLVSSLAAVTVPSVSFAPLIPVATFASVTAEAAILAVVTEVAPKAVVSTAPAPSFAADTASSAIFDVVTALSARVPASIVPESFAAVTAPSAIFAVVIAASDNMRAVSDQVKPWLPQLHSLGTDGFGRSDTRERLRDFFEVDAKHIAYHTLYQLFLKKIITDTVLLEAKKKWKVVEREFSLYS